jgi:hypothetical protein
MPISQESQPKIIVVANRFAFGEHDFRGVIVMCPVARFALARPQRTRMMYPQGTHARHASPAARMRAP